MNSLLLIMHIISILVCSAVFNVHADTWNCSSGDLVRNIFVEYPEGGSVPCHVVYNKQSENVDDSVLWSAVNEEGYCEEKAGDFVFKLETLGWVCVEAERLETAADIDVEGDTDTGPGLEQIVVDTE